MIAPSSQVDNTATRQITLETPRLILRAAEASDAVALHEAFKDPQVMRYWSTPPHTTLTSTTTWLTSMTKSPQNGLTDFIITLKRQPSPTSQSATNTDTTATVTTIPVPLPIGKIGIYRPLPSNEIGFLLSRNCWGQGLAKEAQRCILDYLFSLEPEEPRFQSQPGSASQTQTQPDSHPQPHSYTTLPNTNPPSPHRYPSISADVDPRNAASIGILKRMGFVEIGFVERTDYIGGEWVDSVYYELRRERWVAGL